VIRGWTNGIFHDVSCWLHEDKKSSTLFVK
jgi:hypothetical protein